MRSLLVLLLVAPWDDVEKAQVELTNAFQNFDRNSAKRAAATLAKLNAENCPEAFSAAFKTGAELLTETEKQESKWAKEMDANALYRDQDNRLVSKGETAKYFAAKKYFDLIFPKAEALRWAVPHSMLEMSRLSNPGAAPALAAILKSSPEWLPRAAAAEALARMDSPDGFDAILARAKVEDIGTAKVALAQALGSRAKESDAARKLLVAWLDNPFWQIRLAAAQGIARSADKRLAPQLIAQLQKSQGRLKHEFNECLKTLTGVDKHGDFGAWKAWWDKNNEEVLAGTYVIRPFEQADERGLTTFYGIGFHSSRVVFILDISDSMKDTSKWKPDVANDSDKPEGNRRIDIAKYELRKVLRTMPDGAQFNLVLLATNITLLHEQMMTASRETREKALKFVQGFKVGNGTNISGAFNRTLVFAGGSWNAPLKQDSIDTIYFISDGVPTYGMLDREALVDRIIDAVRYKKVAIHSIAIDPIAEGKMVMKGLAEGSGGQYVER